MSASPLLYSQVRMLAEAALGVPDGQTSAFWFSSQNTNGPVLVQPGALPSPQDVVVPASNVTTIAPLAQVRLASGTGDPGVNVMDLQPGALNPVQADAAFWTDASVYKFVLPYYASCKGYDAWSGVSRLMRVWNGSLPDGRQPYALLHVTGASIPPAGGQPTSLEPIWVVSLDSAGVSRAQPLADFSDPLPELSPQAVPEPPVEYTPPASFSGPAPTYGALRSMAEWSASINGSFTYFQYDPEANVFNQTSTPPIDGSAVVIPVFNPNVPANRPTDISVTVTLPGGVTGSVFDFMSYEKDGGAASYPDAFLWSTGAIEQFMLPYYASIDGFGGLPDLLSIQNAWLQNFQGMGGYFTGGASGSFLGPDAGEVLGLVHIPRSIWVTEEESAALGQTGFVHVAGKGVRTTRASRFIARSRASR